MRTTLVALAALAISTPLAAQANGMAGMNMDPTKAIHGTGVLPTGWMMRFDPPRRGPAPTPDQIMFVTMGSGYHFTTGPAAVYYNPKDMASGEYLVSATFSQRKSMGHEAYGIFIGGKNLQDSTQSYTYLVIKPCRSSGDCKEPGATLGEVLISQRTSDGRPAALLPIGHSDAVNVDDPTDGHATNKLSIHVAKDSVHFLVNDKLVKAFAKSQLNGLSTDGQAGIRVNHNSDLHVDWKGVTK
ncbi:MAG: hypothetical protein JWM41_4870 [Gemmatimonadetes bacterium]|nr:hypothetical protein [Gemmatimonadota bacterium]